MTEETPKAGRSRIIKNLAPSLTERGKIKIGEKGKMIKSRQGNEFQLPVKLEYFRVVSLHRGEDGNYISDAAVHVMFGDKPTELPVRLLFDDIELNFQCRYSCFKGKQQWCSGDGEYGWRIIDDKTGETKPFKCPCHRQDPTYTDKDKCKINSVLSVLIDGVETIGGVWKFRTTSYNTTVGLLSSLTLIKSVTGGPLAGIPLILYISPKTVISPADGKVQTIYIVGLEYRGSFDALQELGYTHALDRQKHMIRMEDIEDNARKLLQSGENIVDEDVVEEFYPEQVTGSSEQKATDLTTKIKEKPEYKVEDPAEALKKKLDDGDKGIEGYQDLKGEEKEETKPTVDALTGAKLEEDEPEGVIPDGVEPAEWMVACRPSSSIANARAFVAVYKAQKDNVEVMDEKIKNQLKKKLVKTQAYLSEKLKTDAAPEEAPPPPDDDQAPFEQNQEPEYDPASRMAFIKKMQEYIEIDSDKYREIMKKFEFESFNDVPQKTVDEDYILGCLAEKFAE